MNQEMYEEVSALVGIFDGCTVDGEDVWCFKLIKDIIDGKVLIETISEDRKKLAQKQINDSFEWLERLGPNIKIRFKEEILALIN